MAKLILTGQYEAIDLKALHGEDIQQLDAVVDGICQRNGGFAELVLDIIQTFIVRCTINKETYKFQKKKG